ncbi:hypothetical protein [Amycolatopsis vastitatis]|uniref:hypothetical protein n=1 Tax=Amycolatopsis vastitatis TaxID=1905142 RepID=UPI0011784D4E|nr:hypothetical protein [Amycolatopsis vastitatis]
MTAFSTDRQQETPVIEENAGSSLARRNPSATKELAARKRRRRDPERVNPMHTHLIIVLGQLVSLLG